MIVELQKKRYERQNSVDLDYENAIQLWKVKFLNDEFSKTKVPTMLMLFKWLLRYMWLDGELGGSLGFMINSHILRNSLGLLVRAKMF